MKKTVIDAPFAIGYIDNLIQAFAIHSPDSLSGMVGYVHLSGVFLPILPILNEYNDYVIDFGKTAELDQRDALIKDFVDYLEHRKSMTTGDIEPTNRLESIVYDSGIDIDKRLEAEIILGYITCLRIILQNKILYLKSEILTLLNDFQEQVANLHYDELINKIRQLIEADQFSDATMEIKKLNAVIKL